MLLEMKALYPLVESKNTYYRRKGAVCVLETLAKRYVMVSALCASRNQSWSALAVRTIRTGTFSCATVKLGVIAFTKT